MLYFLNLLNIFNFYGWVFRRKINIAPARKQKIQIHSRGNIGLKINIYKKWKIKIGALVFFHFNFYPLFCNYINTCCISFLFPIYSFPFIFLPFNVITLNNLEEITQSTKSYNYTKVRQKHKNHFNYRAKNNFFCNEDDSKIM